MKKIIVPFALMMASLSAYGMGDKELAERIAEQTEVKQGQVEEVLAAFKAQVIASLATGEEIRLDRFGKFYIKHRDAREARNPGTGETVQVPPRNYLRFSAFDSGNKRLN